MKVFKCPDCKEDCEHKEELQENGHFFNIWKCQICELEYKQRIMAVQEFIDFGLSMLTRDYLISEKGKRK